MDEEFLADLADSLWLGKVCVINTSEAALWAQRVQVNVVCARRKSMSGLIGMCLLVVDITSGGAYCSVHGYVV